MPNQNEKSQPALFLVATPIGNLEDISLRALRVLKEVDLIACEDTRHTGKLLSYYGITTRRESHHEHNEAAHTERLLGMLREGKKIALVTDAGMPVVSDPGYLLVSSCRREGIPVIPIPGPSAAVTALAVSGLPAEGFLFAGFLPPRAGSRRKRLEKLAGESATLIFYEAPHRILRALEDLVEILGPRQACLAREMTKIHEEFLHGTLTEIRKNLRGRQRIQGEITLVVEGSRSEPKPDSRALSVAGELKKEMADTGAPRKEALKSVARRLGISRNEAYRRLLEEESPAEE